MSSLRTLIVSCLLALAPAAQGVVLMSDADAARLLKRQKAAAKAGDGQAMTALGWRYWRGDGVAERHRTALMWFERAVAANDEGAKVGLALCLESCEGIRRDFTRARHLLREAAMAGDHRAAALEHLGAARLVASQARDWHVKGAANGQAYAMNRLGERYLQHDGLPYDLERAHALFADAAQRGDARAAANLRLMQSMRGVRSERDAIARALDGAAAAGDPQAAFHRKRLLALHGEFGAIVAPEAYLRQAEQGSADTAREMAQVCLDINGSWQVERAIELLHQCSEGGDPFCMVQLGALRQSGAGNEPDPAAAAELFGRAVERGYAPGMFYLAGLYAIGSGVQRDDLRAASLYRQASEARFAPATAALALMLLEGRGMPRDEQAALALADRLVADGDSAELLDAANRARQRNPVVADLLVRRAGTPRTQP